MKPEKYKLSFLRGKILMNWESQFEIALRCPSLISGVSRSDNKAIKSIRFASQLPLSIAGSPNYEQLVRRVIVK